MKHKIVFIALVTLVLTMLMTSCQGEPTLAAVTPADVWARVREFCLWLVSIPEVKFIGAHVLINVLVALAAAIYANDFKLYKVAEFLYRKLLPYILVYTAVRIFGDAVGLAFLAVSVFALIEVALLADLVENLDTLGIKLPDRVYNLVSKS